MFCLMKSDLLSQSTTCVGYIHYSYEYVYFIRLYCMGEIGPLTTYEDEKEVSPPPGDLAAAADENREPVQPYILANSQTGTCGLQSYTAVYG